MHCLCGTMVGVSKVYSQNFGKRMLFLTCCCCFSDLINQNNQNSQWKNLSGFRNRKSQKIIFGLNLELPLIVRPWRCFWYARRQHFLDLEWAINFVKHDGMQAMFHKLTGTVNQKQEFDVKIRIASLYFLSLHALKIRKV